MKVVNILNFRKGLATNSSSTHSVIYKNKEDMFEDLNIFEIDYYDRCDSTIAASKSAKLKYILANIYYREDLVKLLAVKYPEIEQYYPLVMNALKNEKAGNWDTDFGMYNRGNLYTANNIQLSYDFLVDLIEDENKVIIGGSDEMDFVYDTTGGHTEVVTPDSVHGDMSKYTYKNGNYYVAFSWDYKKGKYPMEQMDSNWYRGKIRFNFDGAGPIPERPELVDLKITNKCSNGCPMCFENSTPKGKHADIRYLKQCVDNLSNRGHNTIEYSIGGGNVIEYPHLLELLDYIHGTNGVACVTVKTTDCEKILKSRKLREIFMNHIDGVGISVFNVDDMKAAFDFNTEINKGKNFYDKVYVTAHLIPEWLGIDKMKEILAYVKSEESKDTGRRYMNLLYLGYKSLGRGSYCKSYTLSDDDLAVIFDGMYTVAIDTLFAQRFKTWLDENFYTEKTVTLNEGEFSMYIDGVKKTAYKSSYDTTKPYQMPYPSDVVEIFSNIREDSGFKKYDKLNSSIYNK